MINVGEDPCGNQVDAEIAALEHYQALQRGGHPAPAVAMAKQFYDAAQAARENCRRQAGMQVQIVVQPGKTKEETLSNLQQEIAKRQAAGDLQAVQQLNRTAKEIKNLPQRLPPQPPQAGTWKKNLPLLLGVSGMLVAALVIFKLMS